MIETVLDVPYLMQLVLPIGPVLAVLLPVVSQALFYLVFFFPDTKFVTLVIHLQFFHGASYTCRVACFTECSYYIFSIKGMTMKEVPLNFHIPSQYSEMKVVT